MSSCDDVHMANGSGTWCGAGGFVRRTRIEQAVTCPRCLEALGVFKERTKDVQLPKRKAP